MIGWPIEFQELQYAAPGIPSVTYGLISTEVVPDVLLSIAPSFMEFRWKGAGLGPNACRLR